MDQAMMEQYAYQLALAQQMQAAAQLPGGYAQAAALTGMQPGMMDYSAYGGAAYGGAGFEATPAESYNSKGYPIRSGVTICSNFAKTGDCKYGSNCKWDHTEGPDGKPGSAQVNTLGLPVRAGQPLCGFFAKTGNCSYGATCRFDHPEEYCVLNTGTGPPPIPAPRAPTAAPTGFNSQGYPTREETGPCGFFLRTGTCSYGVTCKWDHPEGLGGTQPQGYGKTTPSYGGMGGMRAAPY